MTREHVNPERLPWRKWKAGLFADNMRALIEAMAALEIAARRRVGAPLAR